MSVNRNKISDMMTDTTLHSLLVANAVLLVYVPAEDSYNLVAVG